MRSEYTRLLRQCIIPFDMEIIYAGCLIVSEKDCQNTFNHAVLGHFQSFRGFFGLNTFDSGVARIFPVVGHWGRGPWVFVGGH